MITSRLQAHLLKVPDDFRCVDLGRLSGDAEQALAVFDVAALNAQAPQPLQHVLLRAAQLAPALRDDARGQPAHGFLLGVRLQGLGGHRRSVTEML